VIDFSYRAENTSGIRNGNTLGLTKGLIFVHPDSKIDRMYLVMASHRVAYSELIPRVSQLRVRMSSILPLAETCAIDRRRKRLDRRAERAVYGKTGQTNSACLNVLMRKLSAKSRFMKDSCVGYFSTDNTVHKR
jgi:hypothetical protein